MRARFLTSASTTHHGASGMSVAANIASLAREKSTQRLRASRSIGLSFQRLVGSFSRDWNRFSCSVSLTENQYLTSVMPLRTSIRSNSGHEWRNSWYSSSVQKPITRSTPARLYQERSNRTISPRVGRGGKERRQDHGPRPPPARAACSQGRASGAGSPRGGGGVT